MRQSRRQFIQVIAKGGLFVAGYPVIGSNWLFAAFDPTPQQTAGPYYMEGAPVRDRLMEPGDHGIPLLVSGQVVDTEERYVQDAKIEIWHADSGGQYDLDGFRYRAQIPVDQKGIYKFSTVLPGNYGGRPRHIHYKISAQNYRPLITQLYFANDPFFEGDPDKNFRKDPILRYRELIQSVVSKKNRTSVFFRICLQNF